ncbi:MAG: transcriptional regulator [Alphaproteobacteria bacterium]|nr:transcriptional regulator [Alphaproteobacteria bacterium]
MANRTANLQRFIGALESSIQARAAQYPAAMPVATRIFTALKNSGAVGETAPSTRLPVCDHLDTAYNQGRTGPGGIPELTDALAAIEPALNWTRRDNSAQIAGNFHEGHANAMIIGKGGLETREDVRMGVSLIAPGVLYPRHRHPPEELYVVLSPGEWMQNDNPLAFKKSGDLVHNTPNIWHTMAATKTPLLAVWSLWIAP